MLPVIAIVGRANVGKSSLFNVLTKTKEALVFDWAGVTRDRQYGRALHKQTPFLVIDTGGMGDEDSSLADAMNEQAKQAVAEANVVLFMVDARAGLTEDDKKIADFLRQSDCVVYLVVNKTDGLIEAVAKGDFYTLGLGEPYPVSASHKRHISSLMTRVLADCDAQPKASLDCNEPEGIVFAIIGKPNVGKSTLTNRLLKQQRIVTYDAPGTTLDRILVPFDREKQGQNQRYTLIDTAGVRRKNKVNKSLEKFSVVKTLQSIRASHVVIIMIDAREGLTEHDASLAGLALKEGRAIVIAINKWDDLTYEHKQNIRTSIERRLRFICDFARIHFISALHGTNVGHLFESINEAYESAFCNMPTNELTRLLKLAVNESPPPLSGRFRIKPKYAHSGGKNPPLIVIHGNQVQKLSHAYQRYLINYFRQAYHLMGTPVSLELRETANPYENQQKNKKKS